MTYKVGIQLSDRELLELAAKAAGLVIFGSAPGRPGVDVYGETARSKVKWWSPLTDDGDALRLAVSLDIRVRWHSVLNQSLAQALFGQEVAVNGEDHGGDRYAATRRAIVVVAAAIAIGKALP